MPAMVAADADPALVLVRSNSFSLVQAPSFLTPVSEKLWLLDKSKSCNDVRLDRLSSPLSVIVVLLSSRWRTLLQAPSVLADASSTLTPSRRTAFRFFNLLRVPIPAEVTLLPAIRTVSNDWHLASACKSL